ncbi:MAG: hypothetical protein ABI623_09820 [bacterium]
MKTLATLLLLLLVMFAAGAQPKKYDIKSGIITFETTMKMAGMTIPKKDIVYFDDYGMKECKDTYKDDKLSESFFSDGKFLYKVIHDDKTAYKSGNAYRGTEMKFDWNEISANDKKAGKAKQVGDMKVAEKPCKAYEYSSGGNTTTFAGWNGITLLTDLKSKSISSVSRAVKIEENAKVPASKFAVPAGYALK